MKLLENDLIDESPELAHAPPIKIQVILIFGMIYHIEITNEEPWV
jgi:hypothetical protein